MWFGSLLVFVLVFGIRLQAAELTDDELVTLAPHMVKVQYHLQFHHGQEPQAPGWMEQCPNCGRYHINRASSAVREERPAELPGILLSPASVLMPDPLVHPRFIEKITVVRGEDVRSAGISDYAIHHSGLLLELDEPMPGSGELAFDGSQEGPQFAVTYREVNGRWLVRAAAVDTSPTINEAGETLITVPAPSLVVDSEGQPLGAALQAELPAEDWVRTPADWEWMSREEHKRRLDAISEIADSSVIRVRLNFRSPKSDDQSMPYSLSRRDEEPTEIEEVGVILQDGRLIVLAELQPRTTARLERIRAYLPGEVTVEADFVATLKDYGAMVAELSDVPEGVGVELSPVGEEELQDMRGRLLPSAMVSVAGGRRVCWLDHVRLTDINRGWRRQLIPRLRNLSDKLFAFDPEDRLLLMPLSRRDPTADRAFRSGRHNLIATASAYLNPVLTELPSHSDIANIPLSEEEEGRIGWLGLELQDLTEEMAKMAGVTDEFDRYQRSGALVSYVYPDSPAAEAGIESGMVLMRLRLPGQTRPIRVEARDERFGGESFPWEHLDQVPEEYLERIPTPWPTAASEFNKTLTDIGIGKTVIADLFQDGERLEKEFVIEEGPPHYDIAPRHVSERLGLTVRDLTYELRRYFRRPEGEPGVIISKVESGGRASTAGLKPYEIITHVNDEPVSSAEEWEKALEGQKELKLSVRRMARGRVARITMPNEK